MNRAEMSLRARQIVEAVCAGQVDEGGEPNFEHPRRVSESIVGIPEKIVALLHGVVEDGPQWTLDRLRDEGFDEEIIEAVDAVTKRKGEDYFQAILRARANPIARRVKLADLADDMDRTRLNRIGELDEKRLARYARATEMLREASR